MNELQKIVAEMREAHASRFPQWTQTGEWADRLDALEAQEPGGATDKESLTVRLCVIEPGQMFKFGETLALMSEYGDCEAYIVGSGELFWGGAKSQQERRDLRVVPLEAPPAQSGGVGALERDAARYRWLRERDLDAIHEGGVFAGMTPKNVVLNGVDLDAAIDRALLARRDQA